MELGVGVVRLVWQLTMSWVAQGFNLGGGKILHTHPGQTWGPSNHLYNPEYPCREVNGPGCDINP